jgi:hypothetical protein
MINAHSYPNFELRESTLVDHLDYPDVAVFVCKASARITLTFSRYLEAGWRCRVIQGSTSVVTVAAGPGATMNNRQGFTGTSGQHSAIGIIAVSDGAFVLVGDGA